MTQICWQTDRQTDRRLIRCVLIHTADIHVARYRRDFQCQSNVTVSHSSCLHHTVALLRVGTELTYRPPTNHQRANHQSAQKMRHFGVQNVSEFGTTGHGDMKITPHNVQPVVSQHEMLLSKSVSRVLRSTIAWLTITIRTEFTFNQMLCTSKREGSKSFTLLAWSGSHHVETVTSGTNEQILDSTVLLCYVSIRKTDLTTEWHARDITLLSRWMNQDCQLTKTVGNITNL